MPCHWFATDGQRDYRSVPNESCRAHEEAEQARQVAQGQADAAVIAAQGAAEAQIIQAQAQAEANELIGQSLQANPEILQYQYILKLAPSVQTIFIPSGNQFILPLPNTSPTTVTIPPVTP